MRDILRRLLGWKSSVPEAAAIGIVDLTAQARDFSLTAQARDFSLTVQARD